MPKRQFRHDFKVSAVQLVQDQGYSIGQAAKSLGVDASTLRLFKALVEGVPIISNDPALDAYGISRHW